MQGYPEKHSSNNAVRDSYLEFNFFDGVMVDCSNMDSSWHSSSNFSDDLSMTSAAVGQKTEGGTGDCSYDWNSWPKESSEEKSQKYISFLARKQIIPKEIASQNRKPCMSSLGIHMCDCEEDSRYCNLVTCMTSPLDKQISKVKGPSLDKLVSHEVRIKENDCSNSGSDSQQQQGDAQFARSLTRSSSSKGSLHNVRALESDFANKSALAAWAAVMSDSPSSSLTPSIGLAETERPKEGSRSDGCKARVPTLASHLELTESALFDSKLSSNYGDDMGIIFSQQSATRSASSAICSRLNSHFAALRLDVGNLSIRDPVPYGILHGVIHCNLKGGLPNYTFLLDDYKEVLTAKIWFEDIRLGQHQEIWKYSFYSLREEKKRKGRSGWKNWRRKDKLSAKVLGKMKVSSVLCSDEKRKLSVKSEFILFSSRPNDSAAAFEGSNGSTQAHVGNCQTHSCNDPNRIVCSLRGSESASIMSSSPSASYASPSGTSLHQSSLPTKVAEAEDAPRSRHNTQNTCRIPTIQETQASPPSPGSSHQHSELAAMIIDVPLKMQDKLVRMTEQHPEASITVILPSGNHGRPLHDLKGPSPLISRWKEGGKCDCKGWDLGCGLTVLRNVTKKPELSGGREDIEDQSRSLRLYKQDTDQEEASFSLAPQANGLVAVDFCAPLSPLQAFAIAVATLHGRDSEAATGTHTVCTKSPCVLEGASAEKMCKEEDQTSMEKASWKESPVEKSVNSKFQQTWQPKNGMEHSFVRVHASELALSFERV